MLRLPRALARAAPAWAACFATASSPLKMPKAVKDDDESGPKKPLSAYLLFSNAMREKVKADGGEGMKFGDVAKELSARWKSLSDAAKKPYEDQAAADKARYISEGGKVGRGAPKADDGRPKKPASAYIHFSNAKRPEVRKAHPDASMTDTSKHLGEMWKKATASEKKQFEDMAAADKTRYEEEWAAFEKANPGAEKNPKKAGKPAKKTSKRKAKDSEDEEEEEEDDE